MYIRKTEAQELIQELWLVMELELFPYLWAGTKARVPSQEERDP